jgi:hypothetical protein
MFASDEAGSAFDAKILSRRNEGGVNPAPTISESGPRTAARYCGDDFKWASNQAMVRAVRSRSSDGFAKWWPSCS